MSDPPDEPQANYLHLTLVGIAGALVITAAVAIHFTTNLDIIWSDLGLHIGTGIGLFAMLFFVERHYINKQVRSQTAPALAQVESVAQQAKQSLRDIDQRLADALDRQDRADRTRATQFEAAGDYASLWSLLERAQRLGAVSRNGVRTSIPGTDYYLRVCRVEDEDDPEPDHNSKSATAAISCVIERVDRTCVGDVSWMPETSEDEIFLRLYEILAQDGHAPSQPHAQAIRSGLVGTLVVAIESRTNREEGLHSVGKILQQLTDQWVITFEGLENLRHPEKYTIDELRTGRAFNGGGEKSLSDSDWFVTVARDTWRAHDGRDPYAG